MDAAVPVDAKNAPTSDLENCNERSFPQRPHRSLFLERRKEERRTNDKNSATQPSTKSDQVHFAQCGPTSGFSRGGSGLHPSAASHVRPMVDCRPRQGGCHSLCTSP